jgi:Rod binding domain-containing protein
MDSTKLILTPSRLPVGRQERGSPQLTGPPANGAFCSTAAKCGPKKTDQILEAKHQQIAKDFESVLLHKVLEQMKDTIGKWGFEEDSSSRAIQDLFWPYLARDIADNGGLGLWKDIYKLLNSADKPHAATASLDTNG